MPLDISPIFETNLERGDTGPDVSRLQKLLATDTTIYPEGIVSGKFGEKTALAVTRFQLKYSVIVSATNSGAGRLGPKTRTAIKDVFSVISSVWHAPVPALNFAVPSQNYLKENWTLYPKFGHHTGTDYGGKGKTGIPLSACVDGEIIYRGLSSSAWGASLGNHAALYVPSVDKSFLYCHMATAPHVLGAVKAGKEIGIMGNTGKSASGAIHLHLEGFHGRFVIASRSFSSLADIKKKTFDADAFIRSRL